MSGSPPRPFVLIAGGGTAGHVLPGLAVAAELVDRGHATGDIQFVGAERGLEATLVPDAGFEITLLPGRGIQRRLTLENVAAALGLVRAVFQALGLVRRLRPRVVLAVGGFASAAGALAAIVWRVPLVVAEQNARAGASNRLVGRFARTCAVAFEGTDLPRSVVTGNPVRAEVLAAAVDRDVAAARATLGVPDDRTMVTVFAGSLGARSINRATWSAAEQWSDREDLAVYHVIGARDWDDRPEIARRDDDVIGAGSGERLWYRPVRYEEHMETVLAASDLAVCRAGGTSVAELAVMGVPAVLVPLPIATRDHQRANAGPLVAAGAAVLIDDDRFDVGSMVAAVDSMVADGALARMSDAARSAGRPDAAAAVADLVERHAG